MYTIMSTKTNEQQSEIAKNYKLFDFTDAHMTVSLQSTWIVLLIKNENDTIEKFLAKDGILVKDYENALSIFQQIKKFIFRLRANNSMNIEFFKKMIYELNADKIIIEYDSIECLYKYLQYINTFVKIGKLIFSRDTYVHDYRRFRSLDFGENNANELIQNILDICCGLIEKEIISQVEISNWGTDTFQVSDNIRAVCIYNNLFLTLGKPGDVTGKIEHINDEHEIAWEND